jgi:molybdate transport system ATP-binding protein
VKSASAPPVASLGLSSELEVRIRKRFPNPEGSFLLNVHFRAQPGFTILFGASGSGKTTLLDCIAGLTDPDEGRIVIGGDAVYDSDSKDSESKRNIPAWKRGIGYVLQDLALFPHLTAEQNVAYGLRRLSASDRRKRSREILNAFRIEHLRDRRPTQISGGERQRVALARALVIEPRALLLDEPLVALDRPTRSLILSDLRRWNQNYRIPILFVTHSGEEVFALGEEVIVLEAGKIVAQGQPKDVMHAPRLETVAQLSGFENIFDATVAAVNEDRGTMTCRIGAGPVNIETPLVRIEAGARLRVGIRAGDILLAMENPRGLSARNVVPGKIQCLEQRHGVVSAAIDCGGTQFEVHLTLAAREALALCPGKSVWVVIKTHSCHLLGD